MGLAETNKIIGELKELVTNMHRDASILDSVLQDLEINYRDDPEHQRVLVAMMRMYRNDRSKAIGCDNLKEKENKLWDRMRDL